MIAVVFASFGLALIGMWLYWQGWDAASGEDRRARAYWWQVRFMPWPYHNGVAASLPIGISLVFAAGGVLLPNDGPFGWLSPAMAAATLHGFHVGVWALIRPPRFLQAPWLRADQERRKRGLPSAIPVPPEGKRPTMTARAFAVSALGFATFALVWLALGFPPGPILIGLAIALPAVAATRLRR
jgi:hypothetical protein